MLAPHIALAPGADENGLATMLATLVRENLEAKPHKEPYFADLHGSVAIVADDADIALTLRFERGGNLVVHDGICGIPDVTIRGPSDAIMALSNMPLATRLGLPIPDPRNRETVAAVKTVLGALQSRRLKIHGALLHAPLMLNLSQIMSIHG